MDLHNTVTAAANPPTIGVHNFKINSIFNWPDLTIGGDAYSTGEGTTPNADLDSSIIFTFKLLTFFICFVR